MPFGGWPLFRLGVAVPQGHNFAPNQEVRKTVGITKLQGAYTPTANLRCVDVCVCVRTHTQTHTGV